MNTWEVEMFTDRMILGERVSCSTDSDETGLNNNVLVNGGSGSGKTWSIVEPRLLTAGYSSLIIPITKKRIYKLYREELKRRGYLVLFLDFVSPEKSPFGFDLLSGVRTDADVLSLAKAIVGADPRKENSRADPYWDEVAVSILCALIQAVRKGEDDKANFADVLKLKGAFDFEESGDGVATSLDSVFDIIRKNEPEGMAASCWSSFRKLPYRTAGCSYSALNTIMDQLFTPEIAQMMKKSRQLDVRQLATTKTVLFVYTSAVNPSLNALIDIVYSQMIRTLFEFAEEQPYGRLPVPVQFVFDDFATGGKILNFPEYISIFREKEISAVILIQSESQLTSMYGKEAATTIINNCDTYIYLGGMDLQSARSVSERLNAPLDEVLNMPVGREIIFRRGQKPISTERYRITEDKVYQRIMEDLNQESVHA